jgi:hypothetical protein
MRIHTDMAAFFWSFRVGMFVNISQGYLVNTQSLWYRMLFNIDI